MPNKNTQYTVRIENSLNEQIKKIAQEQDIKRSKAIRMLIKKGIEAYKQQVNNPI